MMTTALLPLEASNAIESLMSTWDERLGTAASRRRSSSGC